MARFNTSLAVVYTTDFDVTISSPINFKISQAAPIPDGFYSNRPTRNVCPSSQGFSTRALLATFINQQVPDGGTFRYPVPTRTGITGIFALAQSLVQLGAICIDLEGEVFTNVPNSQIPSGTPVYRRTPYTNIPGQPDKTVVTYDYDSDLAAQLGGTQNFSTNFETLPEALANISRGCLNNSQVRNSNGVCSGGGVNLEPRKFIWYADASDSLDGSTVDGTIARQSIVSSFPGIDIQECLLNIAPAIYCARYEGESFRNLQNAISLT